MNRFMPFGFGSSVSSTAASGAALAQSAKTLVGAWTLVDVGDTYGKNPRGSLMFDASGRYALTITRSDLPKFAANSRVKGTPEEKRRWSTAASRTSAAMK